MGSINMSIIGNPKNPPALLLSWYCIWLPTPFHGVQPFASYGRAFFMILSTQLRQVPPCPTYSTPIHFYLGTLFMLYPQLDVLQRSHFLGAKLGKASNSPCIKPRVLATRTTLTVYTKHIYIIKNFIPRLCLQKEEQTDWIHRSMLILIVAIIWSVSNQLTGI